MDQQNDPDLLQEAQQELYLDPVSPGIRFANFIIDRIIIFGIVIGIAFIWAAVSYSNGKAPDISLLTEESLRAKLLDYLITAIITIIYYTVSEAATNGRTIGKMVTGTIAIKAEGGPFTFKDALLRSLCRVIPFEPFSALGERPWHDTMTKTAVVKKVW